VGDSIVCIFTGWLTEFTRREFPNTTRTVASLAAERKHVQRAISSYEKSQKKGIVYEDSQTHGSGSSRRRRGLPGRTRMAKEVEDELFDWFVNTINNVKGRIPGSVLIAEATCMAEDIINHHKAKIERGEAEPGSEPTMPCNGRSME
jgi:hypothetical protein